MEDPRMVINGPREKVQSMSLHKVEQIRRMTVFHILLIMLLVALLIMNLSIRQVLVAMGNEETLGWGMPIIVAMLIGDSAVLAWQAIRLVYKP